jgi:hypothetical protein
MSLCGQERKNGNALCRTELPEDSRSIPNNQALKNLLRREDRRSLTADAFLDLRHEKAV